MRFYDREKELGILQTNWGTRNNVQRLRDPTGSLNPAINCSITPSRPINFSGRIVLFLNDGYFNIVFHRSLRI